MCKFTTKINKFFDVYIQENPHNINISNHYKLIVLALFKRLFENDYNENYLDFTIDFCCGFEDTMISEIHVKWKVEYKYIKLIIGLNTLEIDSNIHDTQDSSFYYLREKHIIVDNVRDLLLKLYSSKN